jgi:hypothetical protein
MSIYIDRKYIGMISSQLPKFTIKSNVPFLANFRCVICGDSKKNPNKKRGYLYEKKSNIFYHCKNCGTGMSVGNLIKKLNPNLYKEYSLETYANQSHANVAKPEFDKIKNVGDQLRENKKINLPSIESLPNNHPAKYYLIQRKIPKHWFKELYYADDFKAFIDEFVPDHEKKLIEKDKRIVIPFHGAPPYSVVGWKEIISGVIGRTITNSDLRYSVIKAVDSHHKLFGVERLDINKKITVVEGALDSLFLDNCIASMDSSLYSVIPVLMKGEFVFVYDNEPRNKDIIKNMRKTIKLGKKICIWPSHIVQKDINDMVLAGYNPADIQAIIDSETYEGLRAEMELLKWQKVT